MFLFPEYNSGPRKIDPNIELRAMLVSDAVLALLFGAVQGLVRHGDKPKQIITGVRIAGNTDADGGPKWYAILFHSR